jgi:hypothetical protein
MIRRSSTVPKKRKKNTAKQPTKEDNIIESGVGNRPGKLEQNLKLAPLSAMWQILRPTNPGFLCTCHLIYIAHSRVTNIQIFYAHRMGVLVLV